MNPTILKTSKGSAYQKTIKAFADRGVELSISEDALELIADHAVKHRIGGRSLSGLMAELTQRSWMKISDLEGGKLEINRSEVEEFLP